MGKGNEQVGSIKRTFLLLGLISIITITFLATSYGLLAVSEETNDVQTVVVGNFNIDFLEGKSISLDNAKPVKLNHMILLYLIQEMFLQII